MLLKQNDDGGDYGYLKRFNKVALSYEEKRRQLAAERKRGQYDMLSWLSRQYEYAKYAERYRLSYKLTAGEIYVIDFGINVNAELNYKHFGIVLTDSNESNPLAIVCPIKSNHKGFHPASDINLGIIKDLDSENESLAIINQIRTIDKFRIFRSRGPLKEQTERKVLSDVDAEEEYQEVDNSEYIPYRLEESKFNRLKKAIYSYLEKGVIDVEEEK